VIDTATNAVIKTVPLGASVRWLLNEQRPFDGRFIWTYEVAGGRMEHGEPVGGTVNVLVIDPRSWAIVERIPVGKGSAFGVTLTPDRRYAVVNIGEENALAVIDTGSRKVVRKVSTGKFPCDVHIDPAGARVFVPERDQDTVAAIDLATAKVAARVPFHKGSGPHMLRVSPDGRYLWVQTEHASTNEILDAQSLKIVSRQPLGKVPSTTAFSPNGRYALITHFDDTFVSVFDTTTFKEVRRLKVGTMQGAVAFRPDGRYAYVAVIGANAVAVIDVPALQVARMIKAGDQPWGVLVMGSLQ